MSDDISNTIKSDILNSEYLDCVRRGFKYRIHKDICNYRQYYDYPSCQSCSVYLSEKEERRQSIADQVLR